MLSLLCRYYIFVFTAVTRLVFFVVAKNARRLMVLYLLVLIYAYIHVKIEMTSGKVSYFYKKKKIVYDRSINIT